MKTTLGRLIPQILFIISILLFVAVAYLTVQGISSLSEALKWEKHTQEVLLKLDETFISTIDAETSVRGFLISADESVLEPYNKAQRNIGGQLTQLREMIADNQSQTENSSQLEKLTDERFLMLKQLIEARRVKNLEEVRAQFSDGRGRELSNGIRLLINRMKNEENKLYQDRERKLNESFVYTKTMTYLAGFTGILFLGIAAFANLREVGKRRKAEEDLIFANKDLEKRVEERTSELQQKNDELSKEIYHREQSEQYHRLALESGNLGAWRFDPKNNKAEVDERGLTIFGLIAEGFDGSGLSIFSGIHEEDFPLIEKQFQTALLEKKNFNAEFRVLMADGVMRWTNCTGQPQLDENGEITYVIGNCRDVTDGKHSEIELKNSEQFNRSVFENSPDCIKVLELDGTLHSMNTNGLCLMEIEDFKFHEGKSWLDFWEDDENEMAYQAIELAKKGKSSNFQGFCRTAKGSLKWWDVSVAPVFDGDGKTVRIISTSRDITERREAEQEREELLKNEKAARKDAEIANRMRDEFLATVSHELRAPLNSILGWGRLLQKGNLDEPTTEKAVTTIVRNAESQNRLIEDLLDVSRIISGKLRLEVMTIKPINIVESALETVRPAADAKGITLEIKQDAEISHISGDPNRLQQVIWNLLSNAIKFTPTDGRVTLEIEREDDFVNLRVKDNGVGIKEEFLPHVFDRFRQADASSIRKFGGLGLGLAIVRHITEMHGGTVYVDSDGEGKGSTFTVRLPLIVLSEADELQKHSNEPLFGDEKPNLSLDGLLILVVDDEEDTRQLLVQALTFYGATVISVGSAEEALSEIQDKKPDFLVSDIGMPDEDGYSLIKKVRNLPDEQQRNIIAVALTAFTRAQDRMRALAAGFQNHVSKPVEPDELVTVIASLTGRLQIGDED